MEFWDFEVTTLFFYCTPGGLWNKSFTEKYNFMSWSYFLGFQSLDTSNFLRKTLWSWKDAMIQILTTFCPNLRFEYSKLQVRAAKNNYLVHSFPHIHLSTYFESSQNSISPNSLVHQTDAIRQLMISVWYTIRGTPLFFTKNCTSSVF